MNLQSTHVRSQLFDWYSNGTCIRTEIYNLKYFLIWWKLNDTKNLLLIGWMMQVFEVKYKVVRGYIILRKDVGGYTSVVIITALPYMSKIAMVKLPVHEIILLSPSHINTPMLPREDFYEAPFYYLFGISWYQEIDFLISRIRFLEIHVRLYRRRPTIRMIEA